MFAFFQTGITLSLDLVFLNGPRFRGFGRLASKAGQTLLGTADDAYSRAS
jgi:hypothetical protein